MRRTPSAQPRRCAQPCGTDRYHGSAVWRSPVAQLAEHPAVNRRVVGSSPTRGVEESPAPRQSLRLRQARGRGTYRFWYRIADGGECPVLGAVGRTGQRDLSEPRADPRQVGRAARHRAAPLAPGSDGTEISRSTSSQSPRARSRAPGELQLGRRTACASIASAPPPPCDAADDQGEREGAEGNPPPVGFVALRRLIGVRRSSPGGGRGSRGDAARRLAGRHCCWRSRSSDSGCDGGRLGRYRHGHCRRRHGLGRGRHCRRRQCRGSDCHRLRRWRSHRDRR